MDRRRLEGIGRADLQIPAARRPAGREAQQETRERIGLGQSAHARRRALVAEWRKIELEVWPRLLGTAAEKSPGLIDAERQWSAAKGDVAQCRRDLAPP